jgi:hypothetical protein
MSVILEFLDLGDEKSDKIPNSKMECIVISLDPCTSKHGIIQKIKSALGDSFSLIGVYGDLDSCESCISNYFRDKLPIPENPGLLLVLDQSQNSAALVYSSGRSEIFTTKPLASSSPSIFYINIILQLCHTVIPCCSEKVIESWYYSDEAALSNPFVLKYSNIFQKHQQNYTYIFGEIHENNFQSFNTDCMFFFSNCLIDYKLPSVNPNSKIKVQKLNSKFVLKVFTQSFSIENFSELFKNHMINLKDYIVPTDQLLQIIYETLSDLLIQEESTISEIVSKMCEDINDKILNSNLKINEKVRGMFKKTSFIEGLFTFKNELVKKSRDINLSVITDQFTKYTKGFIERFEENSKLINSLLDQCWRQAETKINELKFRIREKVTIEISQLENFVIKKIIEIRKITPIIEKIESCFSSIENAKTLTKQEDFKLHFQNTIGEIKQIVEIENYLVIVIEDNVKVSTEFYLIDNETSQEILSFNSINYQVAQGSTLSSFIVINNIKKTLVVYKSQDFKLIKDKTLEIVPEDSIFFPFYLKSSKSLVYVNENHKLKKIKLFGNMDSGYYDLSSFSINTADHTEKFIGLAVSKDDKILVLLTEKLLTVLEFNTFSTLQINFDPKNLKNLNIMTINTQNFIICTIKNSVKIIKIVKVDTNSADHYKRLIGNPILDILYYSFKYTKPYSHHTDLILYAKSNVYKEFIYKYYSNIIEIPKYIELKGIVSEITDDIKESLQKLRLNTDDFVKQLCFLIPFEVCKSSPFEITAGPDSQDKILSIQFESTLVQHITSHCSLGILEEFLKTVSEVTVVSIIGPNHDNNIILANNLFKVGLNYCKSSSITMSLCEIDSRYYIIILYETSNKNIDVSILKSLEFISSISDLIIINVPNNDMMTLNQIIIRLMYCRGRINDLFLYKYEVNGTFYYVGEFFIPESFLLPFNVKLSFTALCKEGSRMFEPEINLFRQKISLIKYRWTGKNLIFTIKQVMAQLLVGDSHSTQYWSNKLPYEFQNPCENKGICDIEAIQNPNKNTEYIQKSLNINKSHSKDLKHRCDDVCPNCSRYCELEYGHFGYHSLKMHEFLNESSCDIDFFNQHIPDSFEKLIEKNLSTVIEENWHSIGWESPIESIWGIFPILFYSKSANPPKVSKKNNHNLSLPIFEYNRL